MKWLFIILGIIVCLVLIVIVIGYILPVKHTVSVQVSVDASPEKVWQRLIDFKEYPQWRNNLKSIQAKSDSAWVEVFENNDSMPMKFTTKEPMQRLVAEIDSKKLPFGGNWEFKIQSNGIGSTVTITENGEIFNPIFRFVSKFIIGHTATLKEYANYLKQSFK